MSAVFLFLASFVSIISYSQPKLHLLQSGKKVSIRGLSAVSDQVVWISGSGGSVAKSVDGGASWTWITVPGYEKRDFRDIEAFDQDTALIMAVAEPAVILKTMDGGQTWRKVFEDTTKGMFLDAMDFDQSGKGMVIGDPVNSRTYLATTSDRGDSWKKRNDWPSVDFFNLKEGEAFFASSGTNIRLVGNHPVIVSGGKSSRIFIESKMNKWTALPIMQGGESTGANSVAVNIDAYGGKAARAVVVGGDFAKDTISSANCVLVTLSANPTFTIPKTPPHGYRSCVVYLDKKSLLTCGTSGVDISTDGGNNWQLISRESFHVCKKAKKGTAVFLAGGGGRIARLED